MAIEIEKKFLVDSGLWNALPKPPAALLQQGYICTDPERTVRVRIGGDTAWLTVKGLTTGASRTEIECCIPLETAEELLREFALNQIQKRRYNIEHDNRTWEVDEFLGDNEGLIVAELELEAADAPFTLPAWVTEEVTAEARYYNSALSLHPFKTWSSR